MALTRWGFIYTLGSDATENRTDIIGSADCTLVAVGVLDTADAPDVARDLVEGGAELIELCGAFGPAGTAAVTKAVDDKVPVGGVFYGGEASAGLVRLFGEG